MKFFFSRTPFFDCDFCEKQFSNEKKKHKKEIIKTNFF